MPNYSEACLLQHQQLSALVKGTPLHGLRWGFLVAAAGFAVWGLATQRHWSTMLGVAFGVVAASAWHTATHMHNAMLAFTKARICPGTMAISRSTWSDAVHFQAAVRPASGGAWAFEFLPLGWSPSDGEFEAQVHFLPGVDWPVLVTVAEGLVFPRNTPKVAAPRA